MISSSVYIYLTWKGVMSYNGHRRTRTFNLPIHKHTPMKTMCLWRGMLYRWARARIDYNTNDCKQSTSSGWFFAGYVCARKLTILVFRFLTSSLTVPATLIIDSRFALKILFQLYLYSYKHQCFILFFASLPQNPSCVAYRPPRRGIQSFERQSREILPTAQI